MVHSGPAGASIPGGAGVASRLIGWAEFCERSCAPGVTRTTIPPTVMRKFAADLRDAIEALERKDA